MHVPLFAIILGAILMYSGSASPSLSCRGKDGRPVDWFVVYKLPVGPSPTGRSYLYRSSDEAELDAWIFSTVTIDSPSSLPGLTLAPLYDTTAQGERMVLMYNDEQPNGTSSDSAAHAKGVVAFDGLAGFWMLHSVPRYPPAPSADQGYSFPVTGTRYGQTILCISLPFRQADIIGEQLRFYGPFVYHWQPGGLLSTSTPNLVSAALGDRVRRPPWTQKRQLTTHNGTVFTSFAKARQFDQDLYGDWMASSLQASLRVETWTNGQGHPLPSYCFNRTYTVENIKQVRLNGSAYFPSHKDHAKWAIAAPKDQPWVCIADINRMDSQRRRGGGGLCVNNFDLWANFNSAVDQLECCPLSPHNVPRRVRNEPTRNGKRGR